MILDATSLDHRGVNARIRSEIDAGETDFHLENVLGQRYIAAGITAHVKLAIDGVPGNDLGAFMDGPSIFVNGNGQDGIGNTMNSGSIVINGDARDLVGHSMRGGRIFIKGNVGYRMGVHMKSYEDKFPVIVVGGHAADFTGEYMAGGVIVILNLWEPDELSAGNLTATGIHGGSMYIRGRLDERILGREASCLPLEETDDDLLRQLIGEFRGYFPEVELEYNREEFQKLIPVSHRPYGRLYAY